MNTTTTNALHKADVMIACSCRAKATMHMQIQPVESDLTDSAALNRDLFYFTGRWLCSGLLRFARETDDQERYDLFVTIWMSVGEQHTRLIHAAANISDKMADYLFCRPAPHGKEILIHAPFLDEWLIKHFRCNDCPTGSMACLRRTAERCLMA